MSKVKITTFYFSQLCEEFVLGLSRVELVPMLESTIEELDIQVPPSTGGVAIGTGAPSKDDIKDLAIELCETFTRQQVNECFLNMYEQGKDYNSSQIWLK